VTEDKTTTRDIFAWLNQVLADRRLPPIAFKLAFAVAQHINKETGIAYPSRARLASLVGVDSRSVNRVTKRLVTTGHLSVDMRSGRHRTNHYRLTKTVTAESPFGGGNGDRGDTVLDEETVTAESPFDMERVTPEDQKGDNAVPKGWHQCHPNYLRTSLGTKEREGVGGALERAPDGALKASLQDFENFWRIYPKQQGVMSAQAAFMTALQFASAGEIIAGAERYAKSRAGEEYRFHKDPARWLQGRHWMDAVPPKNEPAPRSSGGRGKPGYLNLAAQHIYDAEGHGE
jgi:hypothetical protein